MLNLKMPDINTIMIAGNLTGAPTLRTTTNGTPVANFHIASNRRFKDNRGQWRENVCFVGVVAWYKLAESCFEYLSKGSSVMVEGELQSRAWKNDDGTSNNVVEIKARRIQFLDRQGKLEDDGYEAVNGNGAKNNGRASGSEEDVVLDGTSEYHFGYEDIDFEK